MKPALSLCMIVKNEAANLPALLASVEALQAELVIVDTGSQDDTVAIAKAAGAKVVLWQWQHDFAAARNISLQHATAPWILWLDADDRLPAASVAPLRELASRPANSAYSFLIKNTTDEGKTGTEFSQIRMFPRHPRIVFTGSVHEQVYPALVETGTALEFLPIHIHHTGYTDPETVKAKQLRNRDILRKRLETQDVGAIQYYQLGSCEADLDNHTGAEEYFRKAAACIRNGDADVHLLSLIPAHVAALYLARDQWSQALAAFQELADADPSTWHPNQLSLAGQIWAKTVGAESSLEFYEKAFTPQVRSALLPVDPKLASYVPLQNLAEYWNNAGKENVAIGILRLLKAMLQDTPPQRHHLADVYHENGLWERAAELYAWCLEKDGDSLEVWTRLIQTLIPAGRLDLARALLAKGQEKWPNSPELSRISLT